ncbi:MAG: ABC transporter substrate-binding protein [Lachnospiraceae bacterium]|nr:ABC transporter substrate-binding protein [Lachnospiraceae bacterium]
MKKWGFALLMLTTVLFLLIGEKLLRKSDVLSAVNETEMVTLKWMVYGEKYQESDQVFTAFNELLHQTYPNISVEFEVVSKDNYQKKWNMKMANTEVVDLAWMGSEVLDFSKEVKQGSLMALDYLLNTYGQNLKQNIPEELWKKQKRDGNTYAIPVPGVLYRKNAVLTVNQDLMERYGDFDQIIEDNQSSHYTTLKCFEGMETFLKEAKDHNALGTGVSYQTLCTIADKGYEGIYGEDCPFIIRIFDREPVVYNKYSLESYRALFETMAKWYQKGYIRQDVQYLLDPTSKDGKKSGNILFVEEYGENKSVYDSKDTEYTALRGELDGYRFISWESCRNCLVIPKTARHPGEAVQVLDLLNSEEGIELYRLLANGIEKEQYIRISEDSNVIARMMDNDRNYRYSLSPVNIGNVFQNYELAEGEFDQIREYNEEALESALIGFELDTRMFAIEMARVELVVKKYKEMLCQGVAEDWEAVYQEFLQEMKEAGSNVIIREAQKQIDSFLSNP